jgi:hypothetical protein
MVTVSVDVVKTVSIESTVLVNETNSSVVEYLSTSFVVVVVVVS